MYGHKKKGLSRLVPGAPDPIPGPSIAEIVRGYQPPGPSIASIVAPTRGLARPTMPGRKRR